MKNRPFFCLLLTFSLFAVNSRAQESAAFGVAKFAPADGKKLLFLGQDLGSVGGLDTYTDGYVDELISHVPAGVTTYTSVPSLGGLFSWVNWGAGDVNAPLYLADTTFDNSAIAIGLYIVNELANINQGTHDNAIRQMANWIKDSRRPVFLRIGYEFDGAWNSYDPEEFKTAWIHIVALFDQEQVKNVAYVWQSAGINTANMERWYPGDEYVNWLGYSHFDGPNPGQGMRDFANAHDKPIMIAEATPRVNLVTGKGSGEWHWNNWYRPLFDTIYANDKIKALAYINANWEAQPMWIGQGWGDSRVQADKFVLDAWEAEMAKTTWYHASDNLFDDLGLGIWTSLPEVPQSWDDQLLEFTQIGDQLKIRALRDSPLESILIRNYAGRLCYQRDSTVSEYVIATAPFSGEGLTVDVEMGGNWYRKQIWTDYKTSWKKYRRIFSVILTLFP